MLTLGRLCLAFTSVWFAGEEPIDLQARWDRGCCAQANCALDVILCTSRCAQDDFSLASLSAGEDLVRARLFGLAAVGLSLTTTVLLVQVRPGGHRRLHCIAPKP